MNPEENQTEDLNFQISRDPRSSPAGLLESPLTLEPGTLVAERFRIVELLGRGAMGSVYRVEQVFLNKQFALKVLNGLIVSSNTVRRFQNEAKTASRLDHPNLAKAIDFGLIEGNHPFLIMELVSGKTLADHLKKTGRLTLPMALTIFIPVFRAIEYAHEQGVIHRDIKPGNIILTATDGETSFVPKVVDFGIAKIEVDEDPNGLPLTRTGEVFGTPLYMSPEQCFGVKVDIRSDIYSLGCVLFETLTGVPPFSADTALQTMMQHRLDTQPSLKEASFGLDFPAAMETVMSQLLAKYPENRYQNCAEALADLTLIQQKKYNLVKRKEQKQTKATNEAKNRKIAPFVLGAAVIALSTAATLLAIRYLPQAHPASVTTTVESPQATPTTVQEVPTNPGDILDAAEKSEKNEPKANSKDSLKAALAKRHDGKFQFLGTAENQIRDKDLSILPTNQDICDVNLNEQRLIGDGCAQYLAQLPLTGLSLRNTRLSNVGLQEISRIPLLEELDISYSHVTDLKCLANLRSLSKLNISGLRLKQAWKNMPPLSSLTDLEAGYWIFKDESLVYLTKLSKLRYLSIPNNPIGDAGTKALANCTSLKHLDLGQTDMDRPTEIGDETLNSIRTLSLLRLTLSKTKVTKEGLSKLLQNMRSLRYLEVSNCPRVSKADIQALNDRFSRQCHIVGGDSLIAP